MSHQHNGHAHDDHDRPDDHSPIRFETDDLPAWDRRAAAIQSLLAERGILTEDHVRRQIEEFELRTPALAARLVARAWVDRAFRARLLDDLIGAAREVLGLDASSPARIMALENTSTVHHLVVCTLCSCYPRALMGPPPAWYKGLAYRSRAIVDPRGVMREFGLELPADMEIRVVDSTADLRYLVIPRRPPGTENLSESELAELVTRDSMIGVAEARSPVRV